MAIKLLNEEKYGILALIDLAYNLDGTPIQAKVIARRQNIPQRFLEQIFAKLKQANLVVGKRGPNGGYRLARDPSEIKLAEVLSALRPVAKEDIRADQPVLAKLVETVWLEVEGSISSSLRTVSLAEMRARARELGITDPYGLTGKQDKMPPVVNKPE